MDNGAVYFQTAFIRCDCCMCPKSHAMYALPTDCSLEVPGVVHPAPSRSPPQADSNHQLQASAQQWLQPNFTDIEVTG